MPKRTSDFRQDLLADLADPDEAAHYLNAALEDSGQMALIALRDIAEARQMAKVAQEAGVAREALYRMLCESGNPTFSNLSAILESVGLRITVAPIRGQSDDKQEHAAELIGFHVRHHAGKNGESMKKRKGPFASNTMLHGKASREPQNSAHVVTFQHGEKMAAYSPTLEVSKRHSELEKIAS